MVRRKIQSEGEARRHLAAVAASGLSRVQWAHKHGVDARSLNAWRLTLERRGGGAGPRLVELVTARPMKCGPASYRIRIGPFEVDADDRFEEASLVRLLRAVASAC